VEILVEKMNPSKAASYAMNGYPPAKMSVPAAHDYGNVPKVYGRTTQNVKLFEAQALSAFVRLQYSTRSSLSLFADTE
jgi:hypothetical protein